MAYPVISCYPPLGQLSMIPHDQSEVVFTIFVEWSSSRPDFPLEVTLCYSEATNTKHPSQWPLINTKRSATPFIVRSKEKLTEYLHATFTCNLALDAFRGRTQHLLFTFKYRVNSFAPWLWQHVQVGTPHGELLLQRDRACISSLSTLMSIQNNWNVQHLDSDHEIDGLFCITSSDSIPRSSRDDAQMERLNLGTVVDSLRFLAIIRLEPYWIGARHGDGYFFIGEDAIACSFLTKDAIVITLLAFNSADDVYSVFQSGEGGNIVVAARNDGEANAPFQILAAAAPNLEDSLAAVMGEARRIVNQSARIRKLATSTAQYNQPRNTNDWHDGLAYCTWNGIGQDLTTEKLLSGLQTLKDSGIRVSTLLIDDNWQSVGPIPDLDYSDGFFRGWAEFEANKDIAPNGLKAMISKLHREHPYLNDIGVWHALYGYWGGLATEGKLKKTYETKSAKTKLMGNTPAEAHFVAATDVHRFYDDFYTFLGNSGVDFVKTDVQHMSGEFVDTIDRRAFPSAYQSAWTQNYLRHFGGKAISCMSQIPQNIFHSLIQTATPPILLRNSDDFYPEVAASHPWHIWVNAHNSLFTQHLNVLPDWDMFQTSHDFSAYHAAARCISGGPIFITDVPGQHDLDLVHQMVASSPIGRSIVLRPSVAKVSNPWEKYTDGHALKIGSFCGNFRCQTGILGIFNIAERQVDLLLSACEFPVLGSDKVIIRSHKTNQLFGPVERLRTGGPETLIQESLPARSFDILTAYPMYSTQSGSSVAVLGLLRKMTGIAAVTSSEFLLGDVDDFQLRLKLKAVGVLGLWFSKHSLKIRAKIQGKEVPSVNIKVLDAPNGGKSCEIDIDAFWELNEMFGQGHKFVVLDISFA